MEFETIALSGASRRLNFRNRDQKKQQADKAFRFLRGAPFTLALISFPRL